MNLQKEYKSKNANEPACPDYPLKVALSAALDMKPLQYDACRAFKVQIGFLASFLILLPVAL